MIPFLLHIICRDQGPDFFGVLALDCLLRFDYFFIELEQPLFKFLLVIFRNKHFPEAVDAHIQAYSVEKCKGLINPSSIFSKQQLAKFLIQHPNLLVVFHLEVQLYHILDQFVFAQHVIEVAVEELAQFGVPLE